MTDRSGRERARRGWTTDQKDQPVADEKDTDPTPDEAVDGSDATARSRRAGSGPGRDDFDEQSDGDLNAGSAASIESLDTAEVLSHDQSDDLADQDEQSRDFDDLDGDELAGDGDDTDTDRELVGVGARTSSDRAGTARTTGPATTGTGPQKKGRATPKQRTGVERNKRTTPAEFVRGSVAELKKVVYPTRSQLGNYFVVVLVFVLIVIAIVTALDYGFGWLMLKVFA
jgi:preprotein translocase subunit SecE